MKRIITVLLTLSVILVMILAMTSCSEQRAVNLLNKLDKILQDADSFSFASELTVNGMVEDGEITFTETVTEDVMGRNGGNASAAQLKAIYDYDYENDSLDYSVIQTEGYNEEYMYRNVIRGSTDIRLKSRVTEENKQRFITTLLGSTTVYRKDLSYTREGDYITVKINILDRTTAKEMGTTFGAFTPGYDVASACITIKVKTDYSSWESRVDYVFEAGENSQYADEYTPSATSISSFSGLNSTTVDDVDLEGYKDCADVGMIYKVGSDLLDKLSLSHSGASIKRENSFSYNNMHFSLKEYDIISYGTNEKGFYSKKIVIANDERKETTYSEGVKKTENTTTYSTDTAERVNVYNSLTASAFNEKLVCDVQRSESNPNTYLMEIYIGEDYPNHEDIVSVRINVTYKDGVLSEIKVMVRAYAPVNGTRTFQNINYDIKFFEPTE